MNVTAGARSFDLKWFGTLTTKQLLGVIAAFVAALVMTVFGFGYSCSCFGMLIIAVILYMLPKMLGVENIKIMTLLGTLFAVSAILIGGLITAPGLVNDYQGNPPSNEYFANVEYTYTDDGIEINATLLQEIDTPIAYFKYGEVRGVGFATVIGIADKEGQMTIVGNSVSGSIQLESNKLYIGYLTLSEVNSSGEEVDIGNSDTPWRFLTGAYDGDITPLCLWGCLIGTIYVLIIYFMIMIFSAIMRGRMEKARDKMEKDGRLYPKGYGRCDQCGSMVLPGEVKCRKCGAYIDRPEDMKPKKKDFFECSECGAEVPGDAKECPKCGAAFDEEEVEVVHADGTVETTNEKATCRECGAEVPSTASFCTKCGAKTNKK